jgi:hypothetical protein
MPNNAKYNINDGSINVFSYSKLNKTNWPRIEPDAVYVDDLTNSYK